MLSARELLEGRWVCRAVSSGPYHSDFISCRHPIHPLLQGPQPLRSQAWWSRWSWCNNNKNKVHNKCNALNHLEITPTPVFGKLSSEIDPGAKKVGHHSTPLTDPRADRVSGHCTCWPLAVLTWVMTNEHSSSQLRHLGLPVCPQDSLWLIGLALAILKHDSPFTWLFHY